MCSSDVPSSQPSLTADGQLVAFVTKATNLQLVKASGGGDATDGDLLVADVARNTLRRVTMVDGGLQPAVGAHSGPQLSDTGRMVVFDTLSAGQLVPGSPPGRQVVTTVTPPTLSLAEGDLGTTLVGFTSDEWYVAVNNDGPTTFVPSKVSVSDSRFRVNEEESSCALGAPVPPGGDCTVRLTFTPTSPGPVTATLTVAESGFQAVSVSTTVRGAGGDPMLRTNPAGQALGSVVVGQWSPEFLFDVENISLVPTSVASVRVVGPHPWDFMISSNSCEGRSLNPRSTCSIGVVFAPKAAGQRTAVIELATPTGQYTVMVPDGQGRYEPNFFIDRTEVEAGSEFGVGMLTDHEPRSRLVDKDGAVAAEGFADQRRRMVDRGEGRGVELDELEVGETHAEPCCGGQPGTGHVGRVGATCVDAADTAGRQCYAGAQVGHGASHVGAGEDPDHAVVGSDEVDEVCVGDVLYVWPLEGRLSHGAQYLCSCRISACVDDPASSVAGLAAERELPVVIGVEPGAEGTEPRDAVSCSGREDPCEFDLDDAAPHRDRVEGMVRRAVARVQSGGHPALCEPRGSLADPGCRDHNRVSHRKGHGEPSDP